MVKIVGGPVIRMTSFFLRFKRINPVCGSSGRASYITTGAWLH